MAAITFSGINGFDFDAIITAVMQQESQPLLALQNQEKANQSKDKAYIELGTQIAKLQTAVSNLVTVNAFTTVAASSSDTKIVKTTAGSSAIEGHYEIDITDLAKAQVTASTNGFAANTDAAADGGSISFTIGGTTTEAINITSATSLSDLRNLINAQDSGVVASIVNTGTENRLVISSRASGTTNGFTINNSLTKSGGGAVAFAIGQSASSGNAQDAQNAAFVLNGITISSASNTVTTAIPGLTLTLQEIGTAMVDVTPNHGNLKEAVKAMIAEFNKLKQFYDKEQTRDPETLAQMPLANDTILRQVYSDIRKTILGANSNDGRFDRLVEIGVEFSAKGELSFDEAKFDEALNSYGSDLQKLFQGTGGVGGVFRELKTRLTSLDSTAGLIKTARSSLEIILQKDRDRIASQEERLELRRLELVKLYAAADQAITRLNSATTAIQSITG